MILNITSGNNSIQFKDDSIIWTFLRDFTIKRYSGSAKLEIVSDSKFNYSHFSLDFDSYSAVNYNSAPVLTVAALEILLNTWLNESPDIKIVDNSGETLNFTNNAVDIAIQDQHTDVVIIPFNKVTNSTTLNVLAVLNAYTITLTSVTGISDGSFIVLFHPASERFSTFYAVGAPAGNVVTLDSPLDFAYPSGTYVDVAITNMAVNGSSTAQVFGLRGTGSPPGVDIAFDLTRIIFECVTTSAVDLTKFANFTALTNGLVMRKRDGTYHNIFNVKTNGEIAGIMFDWTSYLSTNPAQGVDGFVSRLTFASPGKIGVTVRLPIGEDAEILIQDDLETAQSGETITSLKIIAEGHIVE